MAIKLENATFELTETKKGQKEPTQIRVIFYENDGEHGIRLVIDGEGVWLPNVMQDWGGTKFKPRFTDCTCIVRDYRAGTLRPISTLKKKPRPKVAKRQHAVRRQRGARASKG